jgi:glycosyltransferase involved in cell wall biosynthesis
MPDVKLPRVVLTTHGRFHSFDLAEQLQRAGLLRAIFTPYPKFKLRDTRVDPALIRSFPWVLGAHRLLASQPVPLAVKQSLQHWSGQAIDQYAKLTRPDCEILMALSGGGLSSGEAVQRAGGRYVCDRGSTHMRYQMSILAEEYDLAGIPFNPDAERTIIREEREYAQADAITVPSRFAAHSFVERGVDPAKLHTIPYGVDLKDFAPKAQRDGQFRIVFVGHLGVRKGIGYLLKAFRMAALPGAKLVLIGSSDNETDALLKGDSLENVEITGRLPRDRVALEMSRASVLVLPSIEDGFGMVMSQALACGCPVIATTNTGGEDLFEHGKEGFIVPIRDPAAMAESIVRLYREPGLLEAMSKAARDRVVDIGGWSEYGARMIALFQSLLATEAPR